MKGTRRGACLRLSVWALAFTFLLAAASCTKQENPLFTKVPESQTGINFSNDLTFDSRFNIYTYRNFYNGGGVGLGDFNNDGLIDIYFTGNQKPNRLYLNEGNFVFRDITETAGVAGAKAWSTGVSVADVNGDGWLDIYVCNSGDVQGDDKENELFINNGDLTFTERAGELNLADPGFTTHAVFFDYDRDNDLDVYILNNSYQAIGSFNLRKNERPVRDRLGGDKLMRNDGHTFTDVSEAAGIFGSVIGFGLGATVGDVNNDGWPDIYVSNDFFERDYLYLNQHNGTFEERLTEQMPAISAASMGADMADLNNDGWPEIFVTEMLPHDYGRLKTVTTFDNWDRYMYSVVNGYHHQFTRNTLQLNNRNGTFSEIGRLAGVEATDWSWGALLFDMDNDGWKDLYVANGIFQDLTNQDYLQFISNEEFMRSVVTKDRVDYKKLVDLIPSNPVADFAFRNNGDLTFEDVSARWGFADPGFSNGAAYADLDNDGDLDLVVNHVNHVASIFQNHSNTLFNHSFLRFEIKGPGSNRFGAGAKITVGTGTARWTVEAIPNRGFQSSVDQRPFLGLGKLDSVDFIEILWPDGTVSARGKTATRQTILLDYNQERVSPRPHQPAVHRPRFVQHARPIVDYRHQENEFVDFDRDRLLYSMLSNLGPRLAAADADGNGLVDLHVGGAAGAPGKLFCQVEEGRFVEMNAQPFYVDAASEDAGSAFFDADGDGDMDLYVCSGGNEFTNVSNALRDRLYLNDGKGRFVKSEQLLPTSALENSSVVAPHDFDGDGDVDLFVGIRARALGYGIPQNGYLLENNGHGKFTEVSARRAPELKGLGMITDAHWADMNGDGNADLVIVGEYMAIEIFINKNGRLNRHSHRSLSQSQGWWNRIVATDIDGDGDIDLLAGNLGLNSRFRSSESSPVTMYVSDFDKNGSMEQIVCMSREGHTYPWALRHDMISQLPGLKKQFLKYEDFKTASINQIFSDQALGNALVLTARQMASGVFLNQGDGFRFIPFPLEAQVSPVYALALADVDRDGRTDIVLGGNQYKVKPEVGRYDASYLSVLINTGNGNFKTESAAALGLSVSGEVRDLRFITVNGENVLFVARNDDTLLTFSLNLD
jgi:hypothetical protein